MRVVTADEIDRALIPDPDRSARRGVPRRHRDAGAPPSRDRPRRQPRDPPSHAGLDRAGERPGFRRREGGDSLPRQRSLPSVFGTYLLLDGATGAPLAAMDGTRLTLWRTAAASALAARHLAREK